MFSNFFQGWYAVDPGADPFSAQREILELAKEKRGKGFNLL